MRHRPTRAPVDELAGADALAAAAGPAGLTDREEIVDTLAELDGTEEQIQAAADQIEEIVDTLAMRRAGELFRRVLMSLPVTAESTALQRAILGDQGESIRTAARRCNSSFMTLWRYEHAVKKALRVTGVPMVE